MTFTHHYDTHKISITPKQGMRIKPFIREELHYYNSLLGSLSAYLNREPEFLANLTAGEIRLYSVIAATGFRTSTLRFIKDPVVLPKELEPFRQYLTGKSDGRRNLTEKMMYFFDGAAASGAICTGMRAKMAKAMLDYYIGVAKGPSRGNNLSPQRVLEQMDDTRKRHLQIHRSCMEMSWDRDLMVTTVRIPYLGETFTLPFNLITHPFTMMILKQEGKGVPMPTTPWVVDLRSGEDYLLTYVENGNPYFASSNFRYARKTGG